MRENWLAEIYHDIKKAHNERLAQAMRLLSRKAETDPRNCGGTRLLCPWMTEQEQDDEKNDQ